VQIASICDAIMGKAGSELERAKKVFSKLAGGGGGGDE
jgi:hypothetical protein